MGSLYPIVVLRQLRKVAFMLEGRGVAVWTFGAEVFEEGVLEESAIVLLYPSKDSTKEDAR